MNVGRINPKRGKHIGWFDKDSAIRLTKGTAHVCYALACSEKKPNNRYLPSEVEDTFYIGKSSGMRYDIKTKGKLGYIMMNPNKRLLDHNTKLYNPNTEDKKYRLFHDKYQMHINKELRIWYSITVPNPDMSELHCLSYIPFQEAEYILDYVENFDHDPLMNLDRKSDSPFILDEVDKNNRRVEGSLSSTVMEGNTLRSFFVA